jgi:hypothetical protein
MEYVAGLFAGGGILRLDDAAASGWFVEGNTL